MRAALGPIRAAGLGLNRIALEKIMEPEFHRIEGPPPYVFAEAGPLAVREPPLVAAVACAHEGPGAHAGLNGAGQGRKLAS